MPNNTPQTRLVLGLLLSLTILIVILAALFLRAKSLLTETPKPSSIFTSDSFKKFQSETEFKSYLQTASTSEGGSIALGSRLQRSLQLGMPQSDTRESKYGGGGGLEASRISQTNVQVLAIDEPDIVKTDGKNLYFSTDSQYYPPILERRVMPDGIIAPRPNQLETTIIRAFPPAQLAKLSSFSEIGNLLLSNKTLIVLGNTQVSGFDVSDPTSPKKGWKMDLVSDNTQLVASRFYKDNLYLILSTRVDFSQPCPIRPLMQDGLDLSIPCIDVYHPIQEIPVDITYTALIVNPQTGEIKNKLSFVGSQNSSVVYMSEEGLFITYSYSGDMLAIVYNFFASIGRDLLPSEVLTRLGKLRSYDLSQQSKLVELESILSRYYQSLPGDERVKLQNEIANKAKDYFKSHKRELEKSGIVRVDLADFRIASLGEVPGRPLNQFSLDEYRGNLRIVTTISQNWMFGLSSESASDVYVLDKELKVKGALTDLGVTERIYSVRFVEDRGYVVTFRQTDPFYVLDLKDPSKPQLSGKLKIPGFSSYLHPISERLILGIGREGAEVKLSLFDVSTPAKPQEIAKYVLSEYSSEVLQNQHAFLLDKKHEVFFFPAEKGGYIFSYKGNKLTLTRVVSTVQAQRAVYLDDDLYIIGRETIVVLDEQDWQVVKTLDL